MTDKTHKMSLCSVVFGSHFSFLGCTRVLRVSKCATHVALPDGNFYHQDDGDTDKGKNH